MGEGWQSNAALRGARARNDCGTISRSLEWRRRAACFSRIGGFASGRKFARMGAVLCVGAGGAVGSIARYLLGLIPLQGDFPLITFLINFAGAVIIGAVFEASAAAVPGLSANGVLFLKTGFCGGFTTFSTFSLETLSLIEEGKWPMACAYAGLSLVLCVLGVMLGKMIVRALVSAQAV